MSSIIAALIGAGGSAIGAIVGIFVNTKLITYRLEQLEARVNKHNNIIERTYELEKEDEIVKEKIKVVNHRINDLEETVYSDNKFIKEM